MLDFFLFQCLLKVNNNVNILHFTLTFLYTKLSFSFEQIDGSTLRTICMQHGPLLTFHLGLTQGSALIRYNSRQEAAKAQSALHM